MLRIAVYLESPYKEQVTKIIEKVMEQNVVNYCFQEKIDEKTTFVFVDQKHLQQVNYFDKIIYIDQKSDLSLANYSLFEYIETSQIDVKLSKCLNMLLDYYYEVYYFELGRKGFELNDIVYLSFENHNKIKITLNTNEEFEYKVNMIPGSLPKMFKNIDDKKYVNMMYVTVIDEQHFKTSINEKVQFSKFSLLSLMETESINKIELGDKFTKEDVLKAQKRTLVFISMIVVLSFILFTRVSLWYLSFLGVLLGALIYKYVFLSLLGSTGTYMLLDEQGIYINEAVKMDERYQYAISILKEKPILKKISLSDLRYLKISYIEKLSALNARFLNYNTKSYLLTLSIDTSLENVMYQSDDNWIFGATISNKEKKFINGLYLLNVPIQERKMYRYALNDKDIMFFGYMNMMKWKESIESK